MPKLLSSIDWSALMRSPKLPWTMLLGLRPSAPIVTCIPPSVSKSDSVSTSISSLPSPTTISARGLTVT